MATIDDIINQVNQELEDMNFAQSEAAKKGLTLGDYDLQSATQARTRDRQRQVSEEQLKKDVESFNPPLGAEIASGGGESAPPNEGASEQGLLTEVTGTETKTYRSQPKDVESTFIGDLSPEKYKQTPYYTKGGLSQEDLNKYVDYKSEIDNYFFEKYPEARGLYDKIISESDPKERERLLSEASKKGYVVNPEEIRDNVFKGDETRYNDFLNKDYTIDKVERDLFGISTRGTKEVVNEPEVYGIRSLTKWGRSYDVTSKEAEKSTKYYEEKRSKLP